MDLLIPWQKAKQSKESLKFRTGNCSSNSSLKKLCRSSSAMNKIQMNFQN